MAPKKYLFCTKNKEKKNWQASDHVVPLDACFLTSSRSQMFFKTDVLENFAKNTEKHLCRPQERDFD